VTCSLVKAGAQVNGADDEGNTPLMCAAEDGDMDMLQVVLEAGADVKAKTASGRTALLFSSNVEILTTLIKAGADVNASDTDGRTALLNFAEAADADAVQVLVKAGAPWLRRAMIATW
jgi:ankyrin repeat protein